MIVKHIAIPDYQEEPQANAPKKWPVWGIFYLYMVAP